MIVIPPEILFAFGILSSVFYCDRIIEDYKENGRFSFGLNGLYSLLVPTLSVTLLNGLWVISDRFLWNIEILNGTAFGSSAFTYLTLIAYSVPFYDGLDLEKKERWTLMNKVKVSAEIFVFVTFLYCIFHYNF